MTIQEFAVSNHITLTAERTSENPNMDDSRNMDHWKVTLRCGRRQMTLVFSMGYGHGGKSPEVEDVLSCLSSDSASIENARSFEEWADELGYDTDSRKAEKTYNVCKRQAEKLLKLLGNTLYQQLVWNTEGL